LQPLLKQVRLLPQHYGKVENMKKHNLIILSFLSVVILSTGMFATTERSRAQEDEHAYGEIWNFAVIPVFPSGIRFWLRVEAPADQIQSIELSVWQNEKRLDTARLDPFDDVMFGYEDAVEYEYFLDVQAKTAFRMFDPIKLIASVTLIDGTTNESLTTIIPEHQGYGPWQGAVADERLTIYISDPDIAIERMAKELLPTFDLLSRSLEEVRPLKLAVYMPPVMPFCELVEDEDGNVESLVVSERRNFPCSEEAMAALYARSGFEIVKLHNTRYREVRDESAEQIVLLQYGTRWADAEVPFWFQYGLAMYFAPNGHPEALAQVQRAARLEDLLDLQELSQLPTTEQEQLWRAQSFLLTLYLADLYGADAPQRIAGQISPDKSFSDVLREEFDMTPQRLYGAWRIWLDSSRATEVAAYHPYLENTATSTPIPTITLTRTPTTTPSPTATPTQRPLFIPTNPPLPTRGLPTFTPTVTITPLPPGFFDRITPTAAPPTNSNNGNSQFCNTGLGTLMLPLVAFMIGRKRRVRER